MSRQQRDFQLGDYNDVASRLAEFREKYPDGSLQPVNLEQPYRIETIGGETFIVYAAAAYRSQDDTRPGVGVAQEGFPGKTPYTRGSELQNAETSAWGRAIVAVLAADTKKGIASAEEVRNRHADHEADWERSATEEQVEAYDALRKEIASAESVEAIAEIGKRVKPAQRAGEITAFQYEQLAKQGAARKAELEGGEPT